MTNRAPRAARAPATVTTVVRVARLLAAVAILAVAASLVVAPARAGEAEAIGSALFRRAWVPAPTVTRANDGLGPHFDARSCAACHPGGDRPALRLDRGGPVPRGMVVRVERPDGTPDPIYGIQLQSEAVTGLPPEATLTLAVETAPRRRFAVTASDLADGPLARDSRLGLRLAPALFGAEAIEAVPEAAIRARADPEDRDRDGIAGRVSEVIDVAGRTRLARWGFRATGIDLADQTAAAFAVDMGLSTRFHPDPYGDCTPRQTACRAAPTGADAGAGEHEIDAAIVERIAAFVAGLERRAPAEMPPPSPRGAELFASLGCAACHAPLVGAGRVVHSDLLLHDMGAGLAAGDPALRRSREWRTTPLIGLGDRLEKRLPLLHDGRAATLDDAIARHGGEAATAAARHAALAPADRRALAAHLATFRDRR